MSTGLLTMRVLQAATELAKESIDCAVLHVPTIKPLDIETIKRECAKAGRLVVVAENHSVIGGLGEAVAIELLKATNFTNSHANFKHIALPDVFLDAGALPTLHDRYGISTGTIVARIKDWVAA